MFDNRIVYIKYVKKIIYVKVKLEGSERRGTIIVWLLIDNEKY